MKDEFRIMKDETSRWGAVRWIPRKRDPKGGTACREASAVNDEEESAVETPWDLWSDE
jgi:hypothetical protein